MEGKCVIEDMFSYQKNIDGMKFSIDQLDEQIGEIDKRMESAWMDLKNICETFCGETSDGTLEAVDQFLAKNILENSVCSTDATDSIKTVCVELMNFLKKKPGCECLVFDVLLRVQFKEGLNFPTCFRSIERNEASRRSLFDGDQSFNELFTIFQKNFLDRLLKDEMSKLDFPRTSSEGKQNIIPENFLHLVCFAKEKIIEDKRLYFQRLCLLSSPDHGLVLYANSKSLLIKNKIAELQSSATDFTFGGKFILSMIEEDANFLRFCIEEDDVLSFISTVYLDPLLAALTALVETIAKIAESPKPNNKLEPSKKSSSQSNMKPEVKNDEQLLRDDKICELLQLIGWLIEADDRITRISESSLRCMVGQERSRSTNDKTTQLKSALKNSNTGKGKKQPNRSSQATASVFGWKSVFEKYSSPILLSLGHDLKECSKNQNNFVSMPVPDSLQPNRPIFSVASKNSIELVTVLKKFWRFMKFVASSDNKLIEKLLFMLLETFSENIEMISKKINKEITVESLIIILSGISFLENHVKQLITDIQVSNNDIVDLLLTAKKDLMQLVRVKFINIIMISVWHSDDELGSDNSGTMTEDDENEPDYWIQNWWLQMEWLWHELDSHCLFETSSQIFSGCLGECMRTFAWHFASKRFQRAQVKKFVSNIQSLLSRGLDLLFRCSRRSEEVIDSCSDDGAIHEMHVSCVALTTTLFISACPLTVLKEMYDQFSDRSKQGLQSDAISGSECQWLHIIKPKWNLSGKTRLDQLDLATSYEVMFGLLKHYPFEKECLLLQMMFLHDSNFTILLLRHLCIHEAQPIGNDDDKRDGGRIHRDDGDNDDDDDLNEDKEAALVICSLLLIIFRHRPTEEPVFEHVLGELLKGRPGDVILKKKSTVFKFLCSTLEPLILRIIWRSLIEIEESELMTSSLLASDVSYFSKDRLFCGCKPSESEVEDVKDKVSNHLKIFVSELLRNFHHFPTSVLRFCFKYDGLESRMSEVNKLPFIVQILLEALKKVIHKAGIIQLFQESQFTTMKLVVDKIHRLAISSTTLSSDEKSCYDWFKQNFLEKIGSLGKEILRDRKDENDPGFGLPKSQLSSLVFEILFQSIQSNESSRKSMDILTLFFRDNFYQLNMLVEREAAKCSGGNTSISKEDVDKLNKPQFDFSSLQRIRDEMFKAKPAVFNPLKSHKVFNLGKLGSPQIDWKLCSKLDLGLTEVNLPNLLANRPEFRTEELPPDVDDSLREFLNLVKQKHLRNPC